MQVSGFTFIKNGLTLGYPILESILSIDPLCDEVIINVGFDREDLTQDDGTFDYLNDHLKGDRYRFVKSYWDPSKTKSGLILSEQTNIALDLCRGKYAQYIQGDECIHEDDLVHIEAGLRAMDNNQNIHGLIFNYMHFYGNVDTYKFVRNLYRREVRTIRNHVKIRSWLDAQGFRFEDKTKLNAILTPARIFHYGWARAEKVMNKKIGVMDHFYHGKRVQSEFKYRRDYGLKKFLQTHPQVMSRWIEQNKNPIDLMSLPMSWDKNVPGLFISDIIESLTSYRIGEYKNYIKINP